MRRVNPFHHLALFALLALSSSLAHAGHSEGNGGDTCENTMTTIRDDISGWLRKDGGADLRLPAPLTAEVYKTGLLAQIAVAKVSCTDDVIKVDDQEKACKNWIGSDGASRILCNLKRLTDASEPDRYVLIHHEYAGLAGFEVTVAGVSDYQISKQISSYLDTEIVKKLRIKPSPTSRCEVGRLAGLWAGFYTDSLGQADSSRNFPVAFFVYPSAEPQDASAPCPQTTVIYTRPDLVKGVGTIVLDANFDPLASRFEVSNLKERFRLPSHMLLNANLLWTATAAEGQMSWWDRAGVVRLTKCAPNQSRVTKDGFCQR